MTCKHGKCGDCVHCAAREGSVFNILNAEEATYLQGRKSCLKLNHGEILFKEGQYPAGIYIITSGKIKISKFGPEGREQILQFVKEGDIVGYRSFVCQESYTCTATAITDVSLCFLKDDVVMSLFKRRPELNLRFMKLLAKDLDYSEQHLVQIAQKSVRERVAESLLLLAKVYGTEEDGSTLNIVLKRDELAGIAGTIRETATRFLYELQDSNIIQLHGKKIRILDLTKLERTANTHT